MHVQIVAAVDTRWRYTVYSRLTYVGGGPQGQQIWTMTKDDSALVLSQMQVQQGFRPLASGKVEVVNGETFRWRTLKESTFVGGLQRDSSAGISFQPRPEKLNEGIVLKLSPLLTFEGNGVDAKIDLTVNTLRARSKDQGDRPARDRRRRRDDDRRARRDRDPPGADRQELAPESDAGDLLRHPSGHPRQEERPVQSPDPGDLPDGHGSSRVPRRGYGRSRPGLARPRTAPAIILP